MIDVTDPDINKSLMQADPGHWAVQSRIRLASGVVFSFENRPYLIEPMSDKSPVAGSMKATGGGFSECQGILPSLHGMIYHKYPQGVGYFFPTDTDMQDYVKSRFNPLIQMNHSSIGKYIKSGRSGTDAAGLKRIGTSNLYLRGSTLKPGDQGGDSKRSAALQGIQFDRLVVDEIDQIDPDAIAKMRGRVKGNCSVGGVPGAYEERYIANPSDEDRGVDLYWQRSDQKYWYSQCQYCYTMVDTVRTFLDDPEGSVGLHENGRGYMKCTKCGKPLGYNHGKYIADKEGIYSFYQWSHLASAYSDPARILRDFRDPPEGNLGDIYRLDLGLPYSSSDEKLRRDVVLSCCSNEGMPLTHSGPCAMGVDNDDGKHVVIGIKTGTDRYAIIKVARVENFNAVADLARQYNVKSTVVDLRPNADSAREFQKMEGSRNKVYCNEYTESPLQEATFNENTGVVKSYRTGIFDTSHRIISSGQITLPRQTKAIEDFAVQCCNCVKSKEIDKKRNIVVYRYKKTGNGNDHYRNALNYFLLACTGHRIRVVSNHKKRADVADNNYQRT